jgi:hypothetical protein
MRTSENVPPSQAGHQALSDEPVAPVTAAII